MNYELSHFEALEADSALASLPCLVVGLGNCLLRDDGIGVHAVRELARQHPEIPALEVGTDVFSAIGWLERARWVLAVDAMDAGGTPGTIYTCCGSDIAPPESPKSIHELGLLSVLEFIALHRRPKIAVLGVQPEIVDYGLELSPTLARALPAVVQAARALSGQWASSQIQNARLG